jgi:predicted phage terminase large subunit-like protein
MIALMRKWRPITWWAESGHITKSIGPFLFKRMTEEKVFVHVKEQSAAKDKLTRAQPIIGRMGMGMVMFPSYEPWTEAAKQELMKFPGGRHDDFVDALAHLGGGLEDMLKGVKPKEDVPLGPRVGSLAWVKYDATHRGRQAKIISMLKGM